MDGSYISREEHEEFRRSLDAQHKRLEDENHRQNERLTLLENSIERISAINSSVEKLAGNMERMLEEQVNQGKRLNALEGRDGEMWRKVVGYLATAVVGIVVGYLFKQLGM
jgi:chromosome segregation ATPase